MLALTVFLIFVVSVPLAGGRLTELVHLRLRGLWALVLAVLVQVYIARFAPSGAGTLDGALHVTSYAFGGIFVLANRRVPGFWMLGLGGALNLLAIATNHGVMPILPSALSAAGLDSAPGVFHNSAVVAGAHLRFLGDVFAVPAPFPFHNVFSPGDVCISLGALVALHRMCRSRLIPSGASQFLALRHHPGFARMWGAQAASNLGDWVY